MRLYRSNSLTIEEQDKLLSVCEDYEDLALFKLALSTGIRRSDIVSIEVAKIDLDKKELVFWEQKKKRNHTVPLTEAVVAELRRYINHKKTQPRKSKSPMKLFDFSSRTAYNKLQRALKKAGIEKDISFHDLRRSFVKTGKKRGISAKAVAQITGDTLATIDLFYSNLDMDELKEEVAKL
jgi:integrase